jgi:Zn-dependent protease
MDILNIAIVIGVILVSMTLHEIMHAFMGYWLGDDTAKAQGRLSINPIKHIDPFMTLILPVFLAIAGLPIFGGAKPVPFNPHALRWGEWGVALVAIAGPLTNLVIAFIVFGVGVVTGVISEAGVQVSVVGQIIMAGVMVNLGFFVFNMLPIPPLDGSRVLYALAPEFVRRFMEMMERFGIVVIFAILILASGSIGSVMSTVMQFFINIFFTVFNV